ncbi:Polypyrimidine tract-binding protein 2 [Orobanche gracilis]
MSSVSSQPQSRDTQTPSKVLHLRNLPSNCTKEELINLGRHFGDVVCTKCGVGVNEDEGFIEFANQGQASAMFLYFAYSSVPAAVRGETVYLKFCNRTEIVNAADVPGKVLLVTIEGNDAQLVSLDILYLVNKVVEPESNVLLASFGNTEFDVPLNVLYDIFSTYGDVLKISMFLNKNGELQALIQYQVTLFMRCESSLLLVAICEQLLVKNSCQLSNCSVTAIKDEVSLDIYEVSGLYLNLY